MEISLKTYNFKNICSNACIANSYGTKNMNKSWHEFFVYLFSFKEIISIFYQKHFYAR